MEELLIGREREREILNAVKHRNSLNLWLFTDADESEKHILSVGFLTINLHSL